MRVMIDTNVLLSALIFRSENSVQTIAIASQPKNELLLSTFIIDEAREVIARKWPERAYALERLLLHMSFETIITPLNPKTGLFEIRDPNDYPVVYSAIVGAADVLVTGDKDFADVIVDNLCIITPADFVNRGFSSHATDE